MVVHLVDATVANATVVCAGRLQTLTLAADQPGRELHRACAKAGNTTTLERTCKTGGVEA